ncbi:hypothetical protein QYF61_019291 [Mycteria americana]|uniref:Uncharacterized protein n=1 Tax=Mycteria americana TaxID=33587 RepID=A0AAN7RYJ3_MYCAM|nr:hypothetical protein QYF61_019291 [Mycteria americana]
MEHIILQMIYNHMKHRKEIWSCQHGFMMGKSSLIFFTGDHTSHISQVPEPQGRDLGNEVPPIISEDQV